MSKKEGFATNEERQDHLLLLKIALENAKQNVVWWEERLLSAETRSVRGKQ